MAPITFPEWSRTTAPKPATPILEKVAPSKLTLYSGKFGGPKNKTYRHQKAVHFAPIDLLELMEELLCLLSNLINLNGSLTNPN